jgi:hypothetical protein
VEFQSELGEAFPQFRQASLRVVLVLKAHDEIVGVADDDYFAARLPIPPSFHP